MDTGFLHHRTKFIIILSLVLSCFGLSQVRQNDILYLRNGSTIKGTIVELNVGNSVKIMIADSIIIEMSLNAIEKVVMKPVAEREVALSGLTGDVRKTAFSVCAGMSLPTGSFKSTSGADAGLAKMGFIAGVGVGIPVSKVVDVVLNASYCDNTIDENPIKSQYSGFSSLDVGSWTTLSLAAGLRIVTDISPGTRVYCAGAIGAAFVWSPFLRLESQGVHLEQSVSSATSFVSMVGAGILGVGNMNISVDYTMLTPTFNADVTASGPGGYYKTSARIEQPMNMVRITVGIGIG